MGSFTRASATAIFSSVLLAAPPAGWFMAGDRPADYDVSVDPANTYGGQNSTYMKSKPGIEASGFGTIGQDFNAAQYIGQRVRFSAYLKSEGVNGDSWATLWMRIDDNVHHTNGYPTPLGFTNLRWNRTSRGVTGTSDWQSYSLVLDVPEGASSILLGFALHGSGAAWMSGSKFETVGTDVPVTVLKDSVAAPTNLDFEK